MASTPTRLCERAVRNEYDSQWETICSVADKLSPQAETVRKWVRRVEADEAAGPSDLRLRGALTEVRTAG